MTQAIPVWIVPANELKRNGGSIEIQGGPAYPIQNPPADQLISTDAGNLIQEGTDGRLLVEGYLVYTAILSQTNTGVPVATVLRNTIGTINWEYLGTGTYKVTNPILVSNKTFICITPDPRQVARVLGAQALFNQDVYITSYNEGLALSNTFNAYIEIRVYP